MNCVYKLYSPNFWQVKLMFLLVAIMQATQFAVNVEIFDSVFHLLDTSTNTVEIIKNSLTAMMLNQLDNLGSQVMYSLFKSAYQDLVQSGNFMSFQSPSIIEVPLLGINFIGGIYLARNFILHKGLRPDLLEIILNKSFDESLQGFILYNLKDVGIYFSFFVTLALLTIAYQYLQDRARN